nr:transposase [uncultured Flavobacterium sp.]
MTILFKDKFKTQSNRLQNWDYSCEAVYFITMVTKDRECIFGNVENEKMILNDNGKIIENELLKSIKIRKNWFFHNWIIMPNHIHLLIEIQTPRSSSVETHSSASSSSITTTENDLDNSLATYACETQSDLKISDLDDSNLSATHIVEMHSSASPSSISTTENDSDVFLATYARETHCCAPLQNQSGLIISDSNSDFDSNLSATHIVETHSSASPSSISTTENDLNNSLTKSIRETHCCAPLQNQSQNEFSRKSNSISSFVAIFKSVTTRQINGVESIWQQNYHDHIVRNYKTFEKIYDYIKHNPRSWETDSLK